MSFFSDCMKIGFEAMEEQAGELITFQFALGSITDLVAVRGRRKSQADTFGKVIIANRDTDWLIAKDKMVFNDLPVVPKKGDLITNSDGKRFRVAAPTGGLDWEWSDQSETYYRVHTVAHAD